MIQFMIIKIKICIHVSYDLYIVVPVHVFLLCTILYKMPFIITMTFKCINSPRYKEGL